MPRRLERKVTEAWGGGGAEGGRGRRGGQGSPGGSWEPGAKPFLAQLDQALPPCPVASSDSVMLALVLGAGHGTPV